VKNGETAVVVGNINRTEQISMSGLPGPGYLPGLGELVATQNKNLEDDEFLLVITPHILNIAPVQRQAVWLPPTK
jgi:Flp pilus assembly secretin CpaC